MSFSRVQTPISVSAGFGLRSSHFREILEVKPSVTWMETHPENYFGEAGVLLRFLEQIQNLYPLSFHGVGLSLGSSDPLNLTHLKKR